MSGDDVFQLVVSPGNEAPTAINVTGGSIAENSTSGTVVATLAAVDPNVGDSHTYSIADNALFAISGNQIVVKTAANLDFETQTPNPVSVTVTATDQGGLFFSRSVSLSIANVKGVVNGTTGADILYGTGENDTITAFEGNDTIYGSLLGDTINGGAGLDTVIFQSVVTLDRQPPGSNTGEAAGDTYIDVERFVGSSGADNLRGSDTAGDWLAGGDGADTLTGCGGADTLLGGEGADRFFAGLGADMVNGGAGVDRVNFTTAVVLDLEDPFASTGEAEGDFYVSIKRFSGSGFNDVIRTADNAESLYGGAGDDVLDGRAGDDKLYGEGGADILRGSEGIDDAYYIEITTAVTVNLAANVVVGAETFGTASDGDLLIGVENVYGSTTAANTLTGDGGAYALYGGSAADTLSGSGGVNSLYAYAGADVIVGGEGADRITLSADAMTDIIRFNTLSEIGDIATAFELAHDRLEISRAGFGLGAGVGFGTGVTFQTGTVATVAGPVFLWNDTNDRLSFDANGNVAGGAVVVAQLSGVNGLPAANIMLIA